MEENWFWDRHSLEFLEMAYLRDHMERIENPDGYGQRTGACGDSVEFFILVQGGRLSRISFLVNGCIHTTACCNAVVHLAQGLALDTAWKLRPGDVAAFLKTLPKDHDHCAELAMGGFYQALAGLGKGMPT